MTWDGIVISDQACGRRLEHAQALVRFVLTQRVQDRIAGLGRALPALSTSLPAFLNAEHPERRRPFVASMNYACTQPASPHFGLLDRAVNDHLRAFLQPDAKLTACELLDRLAGDPVISKHFSIDRSNGQ